MNLSILSMAEQSWLIHLIEAVQEAEYEFIHFPTQENFNSGKKANAETDFFILRPILKWGVGEDPETFVADFQIVIVSPQLSDEVLAGHLKNRDMQQVIFDALYSPERVATGKTVDGSVYELPIKEYNLNGEEEAVFHDKCMLYEIADFIDQTPLGSSSRFWVLNVTVLIQ